jgi:D-arabinose 1-dehydrogenase-like Zn-dependent alcohol dehydrogenase
MRDTARAFWVTAPGRGEIQDVTLASPREHEILVRTQFSGISRGTESLVFAGRVPRSEWSRMRAPFQEGVFPAPVKYGYMNVGVVEMGPPRLRGRTVFTLFPHQTYFVVPASAVHVLPEGLPARRAVLAANMETAVNGLWDARPHVGDRIAVIGAGVVGCLVAWLASRVAGCHVQLVDVNPMRAEIARAIGVSFATPSRAEGNCDLVVHASGSPDGLADALRLAGLEATIVEMSWFGDRTVPLQLGEAFHGNRIDLRSSQVGRIPAAQRARWDVARRMQFALDLLRDERLEFLLTGQSRFESLPDIMRRLTSGNEQPLCHVVTYD